MGVDGDMMTIQFFGREIVGFFLNTLGNGKEFRSTNQDGPPSCDFLVETMRLLTVVGDFRDAPFSEKHKKIEAFLPER
jgi:hypothetical protein